MSDYIKREDAREAIEKLMDIHFDRQVVLAKARDAIVSLPSAEPKTEMVLCALADRTCPFQGQEYAWCLTCPHISEEDRELVKKAVGRPTGWIPVSERLPEGDEFVLVTFGWYGKEFSVNIDRIRDGEWELSEIVTAWMPLPEPYKGGEE